MGSDFHGRQKTKTLLGSLALNNNFLESKIYVRKFFPFAITEKTESKKLVDSFDSDSTQTGRYSMMEIVTRAAHPQETGTG